jgi:hypothetical protein
MESRDYHEGNEATPHAVFSQVLRATMLTSVGWHEDSAAVIAKVMLR